MRQGGRYGDFALTREMMETPRIIRGWRMPGNIDTLMGAIAKNKRLFFAGEGSSRIFPAKNAMRSCLGWGAPLCMATEGCRQAMEYELGGWAVMLASNSGKTKEVVELGVALREAGHGAVFGLTAREGTKLAEVAVESFVLTCGWEAAVAATKSVAEQALFYRAVLGRLYGHEVEGKLGKLGDAFEAALGLEVPRDWVEAIAGAGTIYFAGRNDGVAEELTLKTNEITRKKSDYLEGTYAVHGVEEVMDARDVVILIDPWRAEQEKIREVLVDGVGLKVVAVAAEETVFPTLVVPGAAGLDGFVQLAAGWNILVEVGLALGIDLDKPERARKMGNEWIEAG